MALKSTIYKVNLQIADMERHYYQDHALTLARHPSETDERMMVRVLAFALQAHERLGFGQGLSADDEADIWRMDLTGRIEQWIDVGLPDERLLRKASGRADEVLLYAYGGRTAEMWFEQNRKDLARLKNLVIYNLSPESTQALAALAQRTMDLQCTIQDGQVWFSNADGNVEVTFERWQ